MVSSEGIRLVLGRFGAVIRALLVSGICRHLVRLFAVVFGLWCM